MAQVIELCVSFRRGALAGHSLPSAPPAAAVLFVPHFLFLGHQHNYWSITGCAPPCMPCPSAPPSVEIEERHNLSLLLGLAAGLQQQAAVVEGEADHLLHPLHDVLVAQPALSQTCHHGHCTVCFA